MNSDYTNPVIDVRPYGAEKNQAKETVEEHAALRIQELSEAIIRHSTDVRQYSHSIKKWAEEIAVHCDVIKFIEQLEKALEEVNNDQH